jgi:hypothetical protein
MWKVGYGLAPDYTVNYPIFSTEINYECKRDSTVTPQAIVGVAKEFPCSLVGLQRVSYRRLPFDYYRNKLVMSQPTNHAEQMVGYFAGRAQQAY